MRSAVHLKKTVSMILCAAMLLSTTSFCFEAGAFTVYYGVETADEMRAADPFSDDEPAASLAENAVEPVSAYAYGGTTVDVDPRYPGAYYVFDEKIDTDTLTLDNIGSDDVAYFQYLEDDNTVVLFRHAKYNAPGSTISFGSWVSGVKTVNGNNVAFTALDYRLATNFPNTGDNLVPYGDFEQGYAPAFFKEESFPDYVFEYQDGAHGYLMDASAFTDTAYPHLHVYMPFEDGLTYKYKVRIRGFDSSVTADAKAVVCANFIGTQTGANQHALIKNYKQFSPQLTLSAEGAWTTGDGNIITVINNEKSYTPETFSVYTNPVKGRTVSFIVDDIEIYQRLDVLYSAGRSCSLKENLTDPAPFEGFFTDGTGDPSAAVATVAACPYVPDDDRWRINEEKPWIDEDGNEYAVGDEIDLASMNKTVRLQPNLFTDSTLYTVSFDSDGLTGRVGSIRVFKDSGIDLSEIRAEAKGGNNFNGWAENPGETDVFNALGSITPTGDMTVYPIVSHDYNMAVAANNDGWSFGSCKLDKALYNGDSMRVVPNGGSSADMYFQRLGVDLAAADVAAVNVYFDAEGDENNPLCRDGAATGGLYWTTAAGSWSGSRRVGGSVKLTEIDGHTYAFVKYKVANHAEWSGVIRDFRVVPFSGAAPFAVRAVTFDLVPEKTVALNITGLDLEPLPGHMPAPAPVETTGMGKVTASWSPTLTDGTFAPNVVYTLNVAIAPAKTDDPTAYFKFSGDSTLTADGKAIPFTLNEYGEIAFSKTFPKTADARPITVFFDGTGISGVPAPASAYSGVPFDASAYYGGVSSTDPVLRFNGWATTPGETDMFKAVTNEILEDGATLYPILSYDFNMAVPSNRAGWFGANCLIYTDEGPYLRIVGTADDVIVIRSVTIPTYLFSGVSIYYTADSSTKYDGIFFSRAGENASADRWLGGYGRGVEHGFNVAYHSAEGAAEGAAKWEGVVTTLRIDPFSGENEAAKMAAIVFDQAPTIDKTAFEVADLAFPVAGMRDDSMETAHDPTGLTEVSSVTWEPALRDGRFEADTSYKATVTLHPKYGVFDREKELTVTYHTVTQPAVYNRNGTISAVFEIGETGGYEDFEIAVEGENEIFIDGKTHPYTASVVSGNLPDETIVWSVSDPSVATIDSKTGALSLISGGTVDVIAVPAYNPEKTVSFTVDLFYHDFTMEISGPASIGKAERVTQYTVKPSFPIFDQSAKWSVDDPSVASVDEDTGRLTPIKDGTVTLTAVSNYHDAVSATFTVRIFNQTEPKMLRYDPNTTDAVANMPEDQIAAGNAALSGRIPERDGYYFIGWATSDDTVDTVSTVTMTKDVTVYAVWAKGIIRTFGKNGDLRPLPDHLAPGTSLVETDTYAEYAARNNDQRFTIPVGKARTTQYQKVIVNLATTGNADTQVYYKTLYSVDPSIYDDDENDDRLIPIGYETDGYKYAEAQAQIKSNPGLGLDNFNNLVFDFYGEPSRGDSPGTWQDGKAKYVTTVYVDPYKNAGEPYRIRFILLADCLRSVNFDANTADTVSGMPEDRLADWGKPFEVPERPVREGYKFIGWSKAPDDPDNVGTVFSVVDDMTLYAVWAKVFGGESEEANKTVADVGDLDPAEGGALYVLLLANEKGVAVTLTDENGYSKTAYTNGKGAAVLPIKEKLTGAKVSVSRLMHFREITQMTEKAAEAEANRVVVSGSGRTGGGSGVKSYNTAVSDILPDTEEFFPSDGNEALPDGYLSPIMRSKLEGDVFFDFETAKEADLFGDLRQMTINNVSESVVTFTSFGQKSGSTESPAITTTNLALDADSHRFVVVKARQSGLSDKVLRLYFSNDGKRFAESRAKSQTLENRYEMLVYDMSGFADWTGTVRRLRFSLTGDVKGKVEIDWILFTDAVPESMDDVGGKTELFPTVNDGDCPFTDLAENAWYTSEVEQAWRSGLVKGTTETTYEPEGTVTVAEAVTLAVRLNRAFTQTDAVTENADGKWYANYINAAVSAGIIKETDFTDLDAPAPRRQIAAIMAKAVPNDQLKAINMFDAIPDVAKRDPAYGAILKLYNAGVMIGSDSGNNFYPETNVSRAEMAAVVDRIALPTSRKRVVTDAERESLKVKLYPEDLDGMPLGRCVNGNAVVKNGAAGGTSRTSEPFMNLTTALPAGFNGGEFSRLIVGMKWDADKVQDPASAGCALFFITSGGGWSETRRINAAWNGTLTDGIGEMVFDLKSNVQFADLITGLRFDPFDVKGVEFGVAYMIFEQ